MVLECQFGVIEAQLVQYRGMQVGDVQRSTIRRNESRVMDWSTAP